MNVVFWLGVIIAAVALWYFLSDCFFGIGNGFHNMVNNVKNELTRNENEYQEEEEYES